MVERFETFTVLITKINRSIKRIKSEEMGEYDLKSPHVSCLHYLYKAESLTAKELCDMCEEDKASISRSIDYLEANGYVVCDSQAKKRYRSPLTLTEKGAKVGKSIAKKIDRILEEASEGLTDNDRSILYRSLALIDTNLQKVCDTYGEKQ